jgi:hypothetical protein
MSTEGGYVCKHSPIFAAEGLQSISQALLVDWSMYPSTFYQSVYLKAWKYVYTQVKAKSERRYGNGIVDLLTLTTTQTRVIIINNLGSPNPLYQSAPLPSPCVLLHSSYLCLTSCTLLIPIQTALFPIMSGQQQPEASTSTASPPSPSKHYVSLVIDSSLPRDQYSKLIEAEGVVHSLIQRLLEKHGGDKHVRLPPES